MGCATLIGFPRASLESVSPGGQIMPCRPPSHEVAIARNALRSARIGLIVLLAAASMVHGQEPSSRRYPSRSDRLPPGVRPLTAVGFLRLAVCWRSWQLPQEPFVARLPASLCRRVMARYAATRR